MFQPQLADKIQAILLERKSYLRHSTAIKMLDEDAELLAETMKQMKRIRPELFDLVDSGDLIILMNNAFAYEARSWIRNGGFSGHVVRQQEKDEALARSRQDLFREDVILLQPWQLKKLTILSIKIFTIGILMAILMRYLDS